MARLLRRSIGLASAIGLVIGPALVADVATGRAIGADRAIGIDATSKPVETAKQADDPAVATDPALVLAIAAADAAAGETTAALCTICHTLGPGEGDLVGPNLYDIVDAPVAAKAGFRYSPAMTALNQEGAVWTLGFLDAFLASPATAIPGTRMGFVGIADETARVNLLAYLRSLSDDPVPLAPVAAGGDGPTLDPLTLTEEQVDDGRGRFFRAGCADCHAPNLAGVVDTREDGDGDGPPLVGRRFVERWFGGPVSDLFQFVVETMPPARPGTLDPVQYANVLAFILAGNGFRTGEIPLPAEVDALGAMGFYQ